MDLGGSNSELVSYPVPVDLVGGKMAQEPDSQAVPRPVRPVESFDPARLRLKPGVPTSAHVDGGWWPHSTDLTAELPVLLGALNGVIGPVAVVGYHLNAWDAAPDHLETDEEDVFLQGLTADVPHSLVVIAYSGQRVTLLVIPPGSTERVAQHALSAACAPTAATDGPAEDGHAVDRSMAETVERIIRLDHVDTVAGRETIARWVHEAAQQFVGAPIQSFVPILVEHIVRSRLATPPTNETGPDPHADPR